MLTIGVLLLFSLAQADPEAKPVVKEVGPLGQGFNLPNQDLLSKQLAPNGANIANAFPDKCIKTWSGKSQSTRDTVHFEDTRQVYNFLNSAVKIDAELVGSFTFKTSLDAVTNSMTATNESVEGTVLRVSDHSMSQALSRDCLNKVDFKDKFMNDFKKLPSEIRNPEDSWSWKDYSHFIKTYGSHMVTSVTYGASIYSYAFSRSGSHRTEDDFRIKACLAFQGPTVLKYMKANLNASACSGITSEDIQRVSRLHMNDKVVVRGGTAETRAKLLHKRDPALVEQFLKEGRQTPTPVQYSFTGIWELLSARFYGTDDQAKVRNLEQFFKGFLAFGCKKKTVQDTTTTKFNLAPFSSSSNPIFQCLLRDPGCNNDKDCKYHAFKGCKCDGKTCVDNKLVDRGDGSQKKVAVSYDEGDTSEVPGCEYQFRFFKCKCTTKPGYSVIWQSDGLKDEPQNDESSGSGGDEV
ncbi:predicted protein [Nematostella vectensis]|uniref:MACPF domain-containing protein n=1 Tax=Nematostella vectensis TaxID=45351 RepID=A7S4G2_NEMVE|nr:DELTA-alicitoxin-Pse2b [Nematostella vectensis]EDO41387.1 predicted protein [Nematostella vectensis]|eukprot:XP_001633450.1 predicted protein [Nematostella vectensis]